MPPSVSALKGFSLPSHLGERRGAGSEQLVYVPLPDRLKTASMKGCVTGSLSSRPSHPSRGIPHFLCEERDGLFRHRRSTRAIDSRDAVENICRDEHRTIERGYTLIFGRAGVRSEFSVRKVMVVQKPQTYGFALNDPEMAQVNNFFYAVLGEGYVLSMAGVTSLDSTSYSRWLRSGRGNAPSRRGHRVCKSARGGSGRR
jgi:hypothetical protein